MPTRLLTINEAAERLGTTVATLRFYRSKRTGPPSARVCGRVVYREDDLEAWISEQFAAESTA